MPHYHTDLAAYCEILDAINTALDCEPSEEGDRLLERGRDLLFGLLRCAIEAGEKIPPGSEKLLLEGWQDRAARIAA
ncbi:hypothetical protein [Neoroseomonas oryzicola]|nr:hypothetical protein [Neoroseomonas oryzicola]NKE18546.1 hypothetical protein [Neoroseomonas oryzicola]